jgi:sugar lactone lactonase YvrE
VDGINKGPLALTAPSDAVPSVRPTPNPTAAAITVTCLTTIDSKGNVFISEISGNRVRHLNRSTYEVTSLVGQAGIPGSADAVGTAATFNSPNNVCVDNKGRVYVADTNSFNVRYFRYPW